MESSTFEYIIKQKNEGSVAMKKICAVIGYILLFIVLAVVIIIFSVPLLYIPFFLLDAALVAMVIFITWRFLFVEFEIVIVGGEMTLTKLYGKSMRSRMTSIPINAISEIGIYDDSAYEKLCNASLKKNYVVVSSMSAPVVYYALFDEGKDRCVLYFEIDERGLKRLKIENPGAFRMGNIK